MNIRNKHKNTPYKKNRFKNKSIKIDVKNKIYNFLDLQLLVNLKLNKIVMG